MATFPVGGGGAVTLPVHSCSGTGGCNIFCVTSSSRTRDGGRGGAVTLPVHIVVGLGGCNVACVSCSRTGRL